MWRRGRWVEHGGPIRADANLWSVPRILRSIQEWLWLIVWPDICVYIPLYRMVLFNYRPHASQRYDIYRRYGRVRGVKALLPLMREYLQEKELCMTTDSTGNTGEGNTTNTEETSGGESTFTADSSPTGQTFGGTDSSGAATAENYSATGTGSTGRPETLTYEQELVSFKVFTDAMEVSLQQGHLKWGGWTQDTFEQLFQRAGDDWDAAVDAINSGDYQAAMGYVTKVANRMMMVYDKASEAVNQTTNA